MTEKKEYVLCVPLDLARRFTGLSIDIGKPRLGLCQLISLAFLTFRFFAVIQYTNYIISI